jgi:hypothetical protein
VQRLLGCPEPGGGLAGANAKQAFARQALGAQTGAERLEWRIHQHHWACLLLNGVRQSRQQQLPDMPLGVLLHHLHHAADRPAAARQLRIEQRMARRQHDAFGWRKFRRPPHIEAVEAKSKARMSSHSGPVEIRQMTVCLYSIEG